MGLDRGQWNRYALKAPRLDLIPDRPLLSAIKQMPFFNKKPVTIEARQFDGSLESAEELFQWVQSCSPGKAAYMQKQDGTYQMYVTTLEGSHASSIGDFLIKGVKGEFYFCKPDIFEMTYESASLSD